MALLNEPKKKPVYMMNEQEMLEYEAGLLNDRKFE
jgi:hypothetical protein